MKALPNDPNPNLGVMTENPRLSYSLSELRDETSLSVPFWRKEISAGRLKAKLVGRRVVVLAIDVKQYLAECSDWYPSSERK